jgi:hypothetical protein
MAVLAVTLAGYRLFTKVGAVEAVILGLAFAVAVCELPFFGWALISVGFGIPMVPN